LPWLIVAQNRNGMCRNAEYPETQGLQILSSFDAKEIYLLEFLVLAYFSLELAGVPTAFGNFEVDGADDFHAPKSTLLYF
jgi:hypothetical protein